MHFPAFVRRDWIQSAPFFQQIDNVCPINCINSVLADKRSQSKEWLGRKWRQTEERRGGVTDAKLVWWDVSEKMSRETSFSRSSYLAAARLTKEIYGKVSPLSTAAVLMWCRSQNGIDRTEYVSGRTGSVQQAVDKSREVTDSASSVIWNQFC